MLPFFGNLTAIVCERPRARIRVRLLPITKSCGTLPRLRTTNFTVVPAGTERRESLKEKSLASTRIVTGACDAPSAPAHAAAATPQAATTAIPRDHP